MTTPFIGVHEVRLLGSRIAVGYFDDWNAAVAAVENEIGQYKAAYFTLNPVKIPSGIPLNPASLNPTRAAASGADIERRVWLLIDLDPPRPSGTNSTDDEKQSAYEQATRVREWLASQGWPEPLLGDSGNGWHLLYRIELPNDEKSTALLKGLLGRLHQSFPMVDPGNFDAPRICKLYGTWARKGEHSEARPWRRSSIVEQGSGTVTEAQIQALAPAPQVTLKKTDDVKLCSLLGFLDYYGVALRSEPREVTGGWQVEVECPWSAEHSDETRRDTVASFIAGLGNGFKCFHSHCTNRHWRELRAEMEKRNPGLTPFYGKLPEMTHSKIARAFVDTHDDFVRVYDMENATGVWIPGKRWALGDPGDALLRMAIRRYLDELHDRYSAPEPNQKDPRRALQQAAFVSGVLAEVKPWLPPKLSRDFDADPTILPLQNGRVADLRAGIIREMEREDCQTRRISIVPADVPTPRWTRFLREITSGDQEQSAHLQRVMALCITGLALHLLIFFYGRGRNGKGVLLRLLEKILGRDVFAVSLRPEDVEYHRGSEDRNKRLMGRLRGMRLAYTGETVSGHLDWTLLKTLTGGDTLAGADLYRDTEGFSPSHTLILTTNERPALPPTVAFRERLRFVLFNVDFSKSKDFTLEADLAREIPGILWQLIKVAPSVFTSGDAPPTSVLDATADLMDENDVAAPFIEQYLEAAPGVVTPLPHLEAAILKAGCGADLDRIMAGIRARWSYGRKWVDGKKVRGLIGVCVRTEARTEPTS